MGIKENRAYIKMQTVLRVMPVDMKETWTSKVIWKLDCFIFYNYKRVFVIHAGKGVI